MKLAFVNFLKAVPLEKELAAIAGLKKHGYEVKRGLPSQSEPCDLLLTWNRKADANQAIRYADRVLVIENPSWGDWFPGQWVHMARDLHNTNGKWDYHGPERFDNLGATLHDWRNSHGPALILAQRGIGSAPVAMPSGWAESAAARYPGSRIRKHPGRSKHLMTPLMVDLIGVSKVITWASAGAIMALIAGIPVISEYPDWLGRQDNTDAGRLEMLRRIAWCQWTYDEVRNGFAFEMLLGDNK